MTDRQPTIPTDPDEVADYVVIGSGLVGSATAWSLASDGHDVSILERARPANPAGSSHGSARIFRYTSQDPFYAQLVVDAHVVWAELEEIHGSKLLTPTESLDFGVARDVHGLAQVLAAVGVEHDLLSPGRASRRWGGIEFDSEVLWHPAAAVIDPDRSVHAMVDAARSLGARLHTGWEVAAIERTTSGYRLTSSTGASVRANRVVVVPGGWLPDLLSFLPLPDAFVSRMPQLTVLQEQAYHFPSRDQSSPWPTYVHRTTDIDTYCLPGGRDAHFRGQKLAEFCGGKAIASAAAQDGVIDPENRSRIIEYVKTYLPGLVPEPYAETTCLFTMTPTEDFVLDRCEGITVVSACSGQGAKFSPLIGRMAARLASARSAEAGRASVPTHFTL